MAVCRSPSVYLPGGPGVEARVGVGAGAWAGAGVYVQKVAGVETRVPLLLVKVLSALRRVRGPPIWLAGWVDYFCFSEQAGWPIGFGAFKIIIGSTQ